MALLARALFVTGLLLVAGWDVQVRRVPNPLVVVLLLGGVAWATSPWGPAGGLAMALAGAGLGFGLMLPLFAFGLVGAADVKTMAALGAWLGPLGTLAALGFGFGFGGMWALGMLIVLPELRRDVRANLTRALLAGGGMDVRGRPRRHTVPHAAGYALGGLAAMALGWGG